MPYKVEKLPSGSTQKLPTPAEILHPFEDVTESRKAKRAVQADFPKTIPVISFVGDLNCEVKAPTKDDTDRFLLSVYNEVFRPKETSETTDDDNEGDTAVYNGFRLAELDQKQRQDILERLQQQVQNEQELFGIVAEEKKILFTQLEITKQKAQQSTNQSRVAERDRDAAKNYSRNFLLVSRQKLKHLMSESFTASVTAKTAFLENFLPTLKEDWKHEKEAYEGVMQVKQDDINERIVLDQLIREVKLTRLRYIQKDKEDFLVLQEMMADTYTSYVDQIRQDIEDKFRCYMKSQEKVKTEQVNQMLDVQSKSLNNLRNYYQDIVASNADMICDLKKQVDLRRAKLDRLERCIFKSLEELNKFTGPMEAIETEIKKCREILEGAAALREQYAKKHIVRKKLVDDVKRFQWIKEIAMTKVQKYKEEMDHFDNFYFETTINTFQKASLSSLMHSKAYDLMAEEAEIYEICFHTLQAVASQDEGTMQQAEKRIRELLRDQRDEIAELHQYGTAVKQKHEEMWKLAREKFQKKHRSSPDAFGFHQPNMDDMFPQNLAYFNGQKKVGEITGALEFAGRGNGDVLERVKNLRVSSKQQFVPVDNGSGEFVNISKVTISSAYSFSNSPITRNVSFNFPISV